MSFKSLFHIFLYELLSIWNCFLHNDISLGPQLQYCVWQWHNGLMHDRVVTGQLNIFYNVSNLIPTKYECNMCYFNNLILWILENIDRCIDTKITVFWNLLVSSNRLNRQINHNTHYLYNIRLTCLGYIISDILQHTNYHVLQKFILLFRFFNEKILLKKKKKCLNWT